MDRPVRQDDLPRRSLAGLARRTALVATICAVFAVGIFGLWKAADATFAVAFGILIAVVFDAGARGLGYLVPWHRRLRVLIVILLAFALGLAAIWYGGTLVVTEARNFVAEMHGLLRHVQTLIRTESHAWLAPGSGPQKAIPDLGLVLGGVSTVATKLVEFVIYFGVAMFVGAFCAWEPAAYKGAVLSLVPRERRERVSEVMDRAAHAMRGWLIGRGIAMGLVFLFTLSALLLVGMPNPILLALQAGVFSFTPTLGPLVAGIVIVLAGLASSETMALYGLGTYLLVQMLESHVITPLVQSRTVRLPPAITLALQLIAASLFGLLAVVVIIPLAAAGKVFIEELYVNDRLGGAWQEEAPGERTLRPGWQKGSKKRRS